MYGLNIYLMLRVVEQLSHDFAEQKLEAFGEIEQEAAAVAIELLLEEGILEPGT